MGGARCKIIIDNGLGLIRVFWCMATSLFLASWSRRKRSPRRAPRFKRCPGINS
jgi:hypothetical protein